MVFINSSGWAAHYQKPSFGFGSHITLRIRSQHASFFVNEAISDGPGGGGGRELGPGALRSQGSIPTAFMNCASPGVISISFPLHQPAVMPVHVYRYPWEVPPICDSRRYGVTESNWSKVEIVRHSPRDAGLYHEFLERDEKKNRPMCV